MMETLYATRRRVEAMAGRRIVRLALLTLYYALIVAGLAAIYGRGDFSEASFVYQGF